MTRASRVLRQSGLIDPDGDLTEIGREVERYSGEASEALAIAVADRLACVHEVALAIAVLVQGTLYGKTTHSILRTDFGWPPEWRLRATACHRALAEGCLDDLELIVRLASLYHAATDKSRWCRTWWVNEPALVAAIDEVTSVVGNLSAHMKSEAARPFLLTLLPRARAALVYAFQDNLFTELEDGTFEKEGVPTPVELQSHRLVTCSRSLIAFQRYEKTLPGDEERRFISHFVDANPEFTKVLSGGGVENDFDLLLLLSRWADARLKATMMQTDTLRHVREALPIGSIVRLETAAKTDGLSKVLAFEIEQQAFLAPIGPTDGLFDNDDEVESGFDREWDLLGNDEATPDEEEEARNPLDPRWLEINDRAEEGSAVVEHNKPSNPQAPDTPSFARLMFDDSELVPDRAYIVTGCEYDSGKAVALVEPFDPINQNVDPAQHKRLRPFDELDVEVLDVTSDPYDAFIRFKVVGSTERIDVPARKMFSLDPYEEANPRGIINGSVFKGLVVVPKPGQRSLSFKAWMRDELNKSGVPQKTERGKVDRLHSARIVSEPNEYDKVLVELEDGIEPGDVALRTAIWIGWLGEEKGIPVNVGQRLRIGFADSPSTSNGLKPLSKALDQVVRKSGGRLKVQGQKVIANTALDPSLARRLLRLHMGDKWASQVYRLFEYSQTINPVLALPPIHQQTSALTEITRELFDNFHRRKQFEQRFNVRLKLIETNQVEISAQDEQTVLMAVEAIASVDAAAYLALRLPGGTTGRVIGKGGQTLKTLQAMSGVEWLWVDEEIVRVIAPTSAAANAVLRRVKPLVEKAVGLVVVPSNQIGAFIGPKGAHIRSASAASQTRNFNTGIDGQWRLEGSSVDSLEMFASIASGYASGLTLQVTSGLEVEIIAERKPKRNRASSKPRSKAAASTVANRAKPAPRAAKGRKVDQSDIQKAKLQSGNSSADDHVEPTVDKGKGLLGLLKGKIWGP